jgi:hypothetical protein
MGIQSFQGFAKPIPARSNFIGRYALSAPALSMSISNLPQIYRHLRLYIYGRSQYASTNDHFLLQFNEDDAAHYIEYFYYQIDPSTAGSAYRAYSWVYLVSATTGSSSGAGELAMTVLDLFDYSVAGAYHHCLWFNHAPRARIGGGGVMWLNKNPISYLTFSTYSGSLIERGTCVEIYGVA